MVRLSVSIPRNLLDQMAQWVPLTPRKKVVQSKNYPETIGIFVSNNGLKSAIYISMLILKK